MLHVFVSMSGSATALADMLIDVSMLGKPSAVSGMTLWD
jgi:hypothetical protein